jgi:hypothetical protein
VKETRGWGWRKVWCNRMPPFLEIAITLSCCSALLAQDGLRQQVAAIAADAHGKVSVACSLPGTDLNCDLNPSSHPPMQSVFKPPLALTALHLVESGKLSPLRQTADRSEGLAGI